jgi:ribonuclease Z
MNPLYKAWTDREPIKLNETQYTLRGFSIAGFRTNFFIKELNLMLDAGISSNFAPNIILITHGHSDHIANLPFHLYGNNMKGEDKTELYMPYQIESKISDYIYSMFRLSFDCENTNMKFYNSNPVKLTEKTQNYSYFNIKKNKFKLEYFRCDHSVPCIGYGISELRRKLREEYKGLQSGEIAKLKKEGIKIDDEYYDNQFVFLGDTTSDLFNFPENKNLLNYKNIIIECSFLYDDDLQHAIEKKHNHWKFLFPYVVANPQVHFILIHFSPRYKKEEIEKFFEKEKEEKNISNITVWINVCD